MDGIIAQIERFASRYVFSKLSVNVFNTAINQMVEKTAKTTGNSIVFLCNQKMWQMVNDTLREYLRDWKTNGTFLYSKAAGGDVKVGATYSSYEYAGNTVTFQVDKSLTMWYPDKAYGLFLDLTADKTTG
jgi:2',3'-cyclic-nucleotide 2'-phosphodiesterase (5'-nucleotidase family)